MADLAKTSRISVIFDTLMVLVVGYVSPWQATDIVEALQTSIFRPNTVFVGLGVLSFAFVCQVRIIVSVFIDRAPSYSLTDSHSPYSTRHLSLRALLRIPPNNDGANLPFLL
jgi:hypothetical protein